MAKDFPEIQQSVVAGMGKLGADAPGVMAGFGAMHKAAMVDGAISARHKELMAVAIAIAMRCDGCIAFHVRDALKAGATRDEVLETIGVAIVMGGGPSVVYGVEAQEALEQFSA